MYNPALPNHYRDVAFTAFVRRRQREEAEAEERSAQPNALAAALSSVSSSALLDATPPTTLNQSAEELHQKRIKESAALGIASAVAMEKAALEEEHHQRRRDGADARSRIGDRLERLRALSMKAKGLTLESPVSAAAAAASSSVPAVEAQGGSPSPYSAPSTAPLVFQRSSLAAGGYVMTAAPAAPTSPPTSSSSSSSLLPPGSAVSSSGATPLSTLAALAAGSSSPPSPPSVRGKPSSTLLLRYSRNSPVQLWPEAALARAAESHRIVTAATLGEGKDDGGEEEGDVCRTVLNEVAQLCKRFGVVRTVKARVFSGEAVLAVFPQLRGMAEEVKGEQLRLWVRYESATEAFKAAEGLAKESVRTALGEAVLSVVFFPTSLFDADKLDLRSEDELASA